MAKIFDRRVAAKKTAAAGKVVKAGRAKRQAATTQAAPIVDSHLDSKSTVDEPEEKPVRNYKTHTKKLIAKQFSGIMESMAVKSKEGSLAHTKFLFEIGGVKEDLERQGRGKAEPSLADLLLAEVRRQHAENGPGNKGLPETGQDSRSMADDTDDGATD
jgi:hypothetical protein